MLSAKQGGIKYNFLSLWYDSTWDWTPVSGTIEEHYLSPYNCVQISCMNLVYYRWILTHIEEDVYIKI